MRSSTQRTYCPHCNHCDPETHYYNSTCTYEDVYDYPEMHETMEHSLADEETEYKELDFFTQTLTQEERIRLHYGISEEEDEAA